MHELSNLLTNNFKLSKDEADFVSAPKKFFKVKLALTPLEYFGLAQFSIEKGLQIMQTIVNGHDAFLNDTELCMMDLAKTFTTSDLTRWQYKSSARTHTYSSMTTAQAVIVCKLMQKNEITNDQQRALEKIFKALIDSGFCADFLTVKIENY